MCADVNKSREVSLCSVCGNEINLSTNGCPYCGTEQSAFIFKDRKTKLRVVNLEQGKPLVEQALKKFCNELATAPAHGYKVIILIHGYGSSGKGGAIRKEVRRQLQFMYEKKEINDFLKGEDCAKRSGHFRQILRRFPFLERHIRKPNPGITLVII